MSEPAIITTNAELYSFLNDAPTPVYGVITAPIAINFDFYSQYRKVLTVSESNISVTSTMFY
jgi:hypothetical protein